MLHAECGRVVDLAVDEDPEGQNSVNLSRADAVAGHD